MLYENLDKLATYLEGLPDDYDQFHMSHFVAHPDKTFKLAKDYALTSSLPTACGTVACAAGHGPAAGIPFPPADPDSPYWYTTHYDDDLNRLCEPMLIPNWSAYCQKLLLDNRIGGTTPDWRWLFSSAWSYIDNTVKGAAARLRYYLQYQSVPPGWVTPKSGDCELYESFVK